MMKAKDCKPRDNITSASQSVPNCKHINSSYNGKMKVCQDCGNIEIVSCPFDN